MVDYRHSTKRNRPRDYGSRPEQYRLMAILFAVLGAIFFVVKVAGWSWRITGPDSAMDAASGQRDTRLSGPIDRAEPLPPGVFRAVANDTRDPGVTSEVALLTTDTVPALFSSEIDFSCVEDDSVFQADESQAWYDLLSRLNSADSNRLRDKSMGPTSYEQLFDTPDVYRGRVVELSGTIRRAHFLKAPPNDFGVDGYWQCWLYAVQSSNPVVVYCLDLPGDFPSGMKVQEQATLYGVFFKRWAYMSASGARLAPLVVAKGAEWQREIVDSPASLPSPREVLLIVVAALALAVASTGFVMWATSGTRDHPRIDSSPQATIKTLATRVEPSVVDTTSQFLFSLDRQAKNSDRDPAEETDPDRDATGAAS